MRWDKIDLETWETAEYLVDEEPDLVLEELTESLHKWRASAHRKTGSPKVLAELDGGIKRLEAFLREQFGWVPKTRETDKKGRGQKRKGARMLSRLS